MSKKILICDDDTEIVEMLQMVLEEEGHQVIGEVDSRHMVERIRHENPNLVLLDLWMPVKSGSEIMAELKFAHEHLHWKIIVMSASLDGAHIARDAGAQDFLAKPFDINVLIRKISEHMS